jgi:c(7)-type cytochrome triheme protein
MCRRCSWILLCVVVLAVALSPVGLAQTLPKLPLDFPIPRGDGSPGQVTFSHDSHLDKQRPDCTGCHPALFKILVRGMPTEGGRMAHAGMERGRQCGACHNGKAAFGLDTCPLCHRED